MQYGNPKIKHFSEGCFTGKYPTPEVTPKLIRDLGKCRNEMREDFDKSDEDEDRSKMMALV